MKRLFLLVSFAVAGLTPAFATDLFYINSGSVTVAPQIDAINFVNIDHASMAFSSTDPFVPFDTSNTQNFTNSGSMLCAIGWRFDTQPANSGVHKMAANFRNRSSGTITSRDGGQTAIYPGVVYSAASKLLVSATNLINEGIMTVDELGLLSLSGKNVSLNRGGLQVLPISGQGTVDSGGTNFSPDIGVTDNYWGTNAGNINSANILTVAGANVSAVSPPHPVQFQFGGGNRFVTVSANPAVSFVNTNADPPAPISITNSTGGTTNLFVSTNYVVQGAFVGGSSANIQVGGRFYPSSSSSNLFSTVAVGIAATISNGVTLGSDFLTLFLVDTLASETNYGLSLNVNSSPQTFRPNSYLMSRLEPFEFTDGSDPNSIVTTNLLFDPRTFSNRVVTAIQASYSGTAGLTAGQPPNVPGADITNTPGRIEIAAGNLDLTKTRIRADGLVSISSSNLVSSSNTVVDAFNLSFNLSSTNGNLKMQSLAQQQVTRFGGTVECWSGLWTNTSQFVITNNYGPVVTNMPGTGDPPGPDIMVTNWVLMPLTNFITVGFHVLVMDTSSIITSTPVRTYNFLTHSTNVVLSDNLRVERRLITDAQRFTIENTGGLTLTGDLQEWTSVNAPNLLYFTNKGTLSVPNEAHFGDDRPSAYATFVNKGDLSANGIYACSGYFENSGSINANSILSIQTVSGKLENGSAFAGGDLSVRANDFKFRNYTHQSGGAVNFIITNSLADNGPNAGVSFFCQDGFNVAIGDAAGTTGKPQTGDLLGTFIETDIPVFASISHTWPGNDRGATAAGYTNNLALGILVIGLGSDSEAVFSGTCNPGDTNGMYVDYLEIDGVALDDLETALSISPNLIIYFADSNLPADQLDGKSGGHLRWVSDFAGPNSSVNVVLPNGQTYPMNRSLRNSLTIDSDGDGLANGYDPSPLDPAVMSLTAVSTSPLKLSLSWNAAAKTVYRVEFTTSQGSANWQTLTYYTNNAATSAMATVQDQGAARRPATLLPGQL